MITAARGIQMCECVRFSCRIQIIVAILLLPASALVGGCALNQTGTQEVTAAIDRNRTERDDTGILYAETPGLVETPAESRPGLPLPGTLREFIVYALKHNPEIQSAEETAAALAERIPQITALPDPTLYTKTYPEPIRTAEGDNYFILGVQQKFPVPEKLDRAGRIALEETRMAIERLQQTRLQVIADVKRAYFQTYIIDKSIDHSLFTIIFEQSFANWFVTFKINYRLFHTMLFMYWEKIHLVGIL